MNSNAHGTVEDLILQLDKINSKSAAEFALWIPATLKLRDKIVSSDVAMAIIVDKILSKGYRPSGFEERAGGKMCKYKTL